MSQKLVAAIGLAVALSCTGIQAQDVGGTGGAGVGGVNTARNDDNGFDMGLLGLAGLAGLAGLLPRRRDDHRVGSTGSAR